MSTNAAPRQSENQRSRLALIVNNPLRDLAGLTLLAHELARRGGDCFLVPMALCRRELGALQPDFILFNQLRPLNEPLVRDLQNAGAKIGVLDDEGGVFSSFDWYGRQLSQDEEVRNRVDVFCSWGPRLAEHAAHSGWYRRDAIAVTGHPRFDFYAPSLRGIILPDAPDSAKFPSPLILINSRFSRANPGFSTPAEEIKTLINSRGFSESGAREFQVQMRAAMEGLIALANHLAARFPDVRFVFRPHPFERMETYRAALEPRANLILNREGEIGGWLRVADAVIHRSCTTAIEGGMRGVPSLSPAWIETPDVIESTEVVSIQCENLNAMEDAIAALERQELQRPPEVVAAHATVVRDWFCANDGQSHQRVADAIGAVLAASTPELNRRHFDAIFEGSQPGQNLLARRRAKRKAAARDAQKARDWTGSVKYFDAASVQAIANALSGNGNGQSLRIAPAREYSQAAAHSVWVRL